MENAMQSITLYNYYMDPQTGYDRVKRTVITGVSVLAQTKVSVDKNGMASADSFTIRIPVESVKAEFLRPAAFSGAENKDGYFTLAKGDKIVLGFAAEEDPRPATLEQRYGSEYAVTIIGVTDNRWKNGGHWKVMCQ